jgi:hypothetical protein
MTLLQMTAYFFTRVLRSDILGISVRMVGAVLFFALIHNDCNLIQLFSSIGKILPIFLLQLILWTSGLMMLSILAFSLFIWFEFWQNPDSAAGYLFVGINDVLFPSFVVIAILFHSLTYTLLLLKVYQAIKQRKNRNMEAKMQVAWKRLWMFFGLVVIAMPVFIYAETITYEDPLKDVLYAISLNLLGLNVIALVYLFQAIGLLVKSDRSAIQQKPPSMRSVPVTDTKPAVDPQLITTTELI